MFAKNLLGWVHVCVSSPLRSSLSGVAFSYLLVGSSSARKRVPSWTQDETTKIVESHWTAFAEQMTVVAITKSGLGHSHKHHLNVVSMSFISVPQSSSLTSPSTSYDPVTWEPPPVQPTTLSYPPNGFYCMILAENQWGTKLRRRGIQARPSGGRSGSNSKRWWRRRRRRRRRRRLSEW